MKWEIPALAARVNRGRRRKQRGNQQQSAGSCWVTQDFAPCRNFTPPHLCFWVSPRASHLHEQASPNPREAFGQWLLSLLLLPTPVAGLNPSSSCKCTASSSVSTVKHTRAPTGRQAEKTAVASLWNNPNPLSQVHSTGPVAFLGGKEITSPVSA